MIPVKLFRNTDIGSPNLNGTAGSLIALLDACLIDGYNSQAVQSITRSGAVATVTFAANHNFRNDGLSVIRLAGADQAEYNGDFRISNITPTSFDIDVTGSPTTPATGTITAKVAPMDWAKPFSGTNQAAYRTSDNTGGAQAFLRVIDTATTYAACYGYEAMTSINAGTNIFGPGHWFKSSTSDATNRDWVLVADGRALILLTSFHASYSGYYAPFVFGDIVSEVTNDIFGSVVLGHNTTDTPASPGDMVGGNVNLLQALVSNLTTIARQGLLMRDGVGLNMNVSAYFSAAFPMSSSTVIIGGSSASGNAMMTYPNPPNGGVYANRIGLFEASGASSPFTVGLRGWLPGLYAPMQLRPIASLQTYQSVSPQTAGRTFMAVHLGHQSTVGKAGQCHLDITGPWR